MEPESRRVSVSDFAHTVQARRSSAQAVKILFGMLAVAALVLASVVVTAAPAEAVTPAGIASLAQANVGKGAGSCSLVNSSPNSLGGASFYSSCSGYGGVPEFWCADFA